MVTSVPYQLRSADRRRDASTDMTPADARAAADSARQRDEG